MEKTLLEHDFCTFTVLQIAMSHSLEEEYIVYESAIRTPHPVFAHPKFKEVLQEKLKSLEGLGFSDDDLEYLEDLPHFSNSFKFFEFLRSFKLETKYMHLQYIEGLPKFIIKGPLGKTIWFEQLILKAVNETANQIIGITDNDLARFTESLKLDLLKISNIDNFKFSDFGLRRRCSSEWHDQMVHTIIQNGCKQFLGTSNVYLAKKFGVPPIGTMNHQWLMIHQADSPYYGETKALQRWVDYYLIEKGLPSMGICLTDTLTSDYFYKDIFNRNLAAFYKGVRIDSGDPFKEGEKALNYYARVGVNDNCEKTLMFSDSLDMDTAIRLNNTFSNRANISFGIGGYLTNPAQRINMVIKAVYFKNKPLVKFSNIPEKHITGSKAYSKFMSEIISTPN